MFVRKHRHISYTSQLWLNLYMGKFFVPFIYSESLDEIMTSINAHNDQLLVCIIKLQTYNFKSLFKDILFHKGLDYLTFQCVLYDDINF